MSTNKIMDMDWKALGYHSKWQDGMKVWEKDHFLKDIEVTIKDEEEIITVGDSDF